MLIEVFAGIAKRAVLFKVDEFCIEDLDQVAFGHVEVIMAELVEDVVTHLLCGQSPVEASCRERRLHRNTQ